MHTALRLGVRAAERVREINPSCHICFYGLYASLNSEYLLKRFADSVIGGEFEEPLLRLVKELSRKESETDSFELEGVSFRGSRQPPYLKRLAFAPLSYRGLPPLRKYAHLACNGARRLAGYVEASRGCLHQCLHCPIPPVYNGRFFVVPEEIVLDGIRNLVQAGATHITFGDPDFLNGPGHSSRVIRAMHDKFPDLTFDFTAKVEHLLKRRTLLREFRDAGCLFVVSAFESLSDIVLANLNKGHSREDIYSVLEVFREVGITLRPTWVPFTPWTTIDDYIELVDYIEAEQLIDAVDPVQYAIRLLIPPGSALLNQPQVETFLGPLDQANFTYLWTHPDQRMDKLQAQVSTLVEKMTLAKEDAFAVFERVRELAYAARGERVPSLSFALAFSWMRAPGLTESWFC